MLKLKQRGKKGTWWITGTLDGQRIRESTGTRSKEHAEVKRVQRERELLDRKYLGPEKTALFAEAVISYLESGGEARFMQPLLDWFGLYKLRDITQSEVARFASATYPGIGAAGLNRQVFTPVNAVLRHAAKSGLCPVPVFTRPKQSKSIVEYATDDWLARFLDTCQKNEALTAIVLFMTTTGARVSEACRLRWSDVDLEKRQALLGRTKNGDPRRVKLVPVVIDAINALPKRGGTVFGYASRFSVNQAIERNCARAGITYLSSHRLGRHAFAARLLRAGHTLKVVAEAGGWRSLRMVSEVYGHLEQSAVDQAVVSASSSLTLPKQQVMDTQDSNVIPMPNRVGAFSIPRGKHGLYVIGMGGYYKVGITHDIAERMASMRAGSPLASVLHHLEIVSSRAHARTLEQAVHHALGEYRQEGEWFACPLDRVLAAVALGCAQLVGMSIGTSSAT